MTCKSHVLLLLLAILALAPAEKLAECTATAHPRFVMNATEEPSGARHSRLESRRNNCIGPLLYLIPGVLIGLPLLGAFAALGSARKTRVRRKLPEEISPFVAATALRLVRRSHLIASALGFVAMVAALAVDSLGYSVLLALLSVVVLSRAASCHDARRLLERGARAERRNAWLTIHDGSDDKLIHVSQRMFRAAQRAALPFARLRG